MPPTCCRCLSPAGACCRRLMSVLSLLAARVCCHHCRSATPRLVPAQSISCRSLLLPAAVAH
ncbi:hypothetical protein PF005_g26312 [Phytophthora fragariae]|uniref:Uncharacterized protein n=1 Tax=Phytophthora fragariae TaxID=53985 RepID=A0A6A3VTY4_9STRA|nr:hypothetical protein PF003_g12057 [Phytophthora fragariae]KAE8938080.1 hypothetical protein PF009_g12025 [Phytophthora fragariae]KAE9003823.1 hypothetical protein PF011_g12739 [Phytophthora fragariae]KAE9076080.1 hypothetical protein PF010_g24046 [Phytophthora fragariae]KAE9105148.1 hypothetical protein PF007_g13797 [Phytophthora fragariae]